MPDFQLETQLIRQGYKHICGVDEVGRGALFGPVVAGAVILDPRSVSPEIADSKQISSGKRLRMAELIYRTARACSMGWSWNDEIDRVNINEATRQAMLMAVRRLPVPADYLLVDGRDTELQGYPARCIVGGDGKSYSIAAASIIAKVFRDQLLADFARHYPGYDFEKNRGYPTKKHTNMVSLSGVTIFHRLSYNWGNGKRKPTRHPEDRE